jgi:DNA-binding transcriptional LysR family regulator
VDEVNTKPILAVNDTTAMLTAGLAGLGIARTSLFMAAPHLASGTLQVVLPELEPGSRVAVRRVPAQSARQRQAARFLSTGLPSSCRASSRLP